MEQQYDRTINAGNRRPNGHEVKYRTEEGKNFKGSKGAMEKAQKSPGRAKRFIAGLLAAGVVVGGVSAIKKIVTDVQSAKDLQTAVELANEHQKLLAEYPLMQQEQYSDKIAEQKALDDAINEYSKLKDKKDRTLEEESKYIESIKTICESKDLVIDLYTDTIKSEVAALSGITDPEEIKRIVVKDNMVFSSNEGYEHNPVIELNGKKISEDKMDKKIAEAIIEARHLRDVDYSSDMKLEDLPVDDIIATYANAIKFGLEYDMSIDKNGDLIVIDREDSIRSDGTTNGTNTGIEINYDIDER